MKTRLFTSIILLIAFVGCHKDTDIGPAELLYKRWHPERAKDTGDDNVWRAYNTNSYFDIEYRPDGVLIYRQDGVVTATSCCSGSRYEIINRLIVRYKDQAGCPSVRCAGLTDEIIKILREDLLEIQVGTRTTQYVPAK